MIPFLKRSRVTKVLTDRPGSTIDHGAAEERLDRTRVAVLLLPEQAKTAAGQAAALTAIRTSVKCFGNATLVTASNPKLARPLPVGKTLRIAAKALGALVSEDVPDYATHTIVIGDGPVPTDLAFVRCWWDGWKAGVIPAWDDRKLGKSTNPLAGIFAGSLAVREVFASVLQYPRSGERASIVSLWEPWVDPDQSSAEPGSVDLPRSFWVVGLGHLGQGFLWNLGFLPITEGQLILQDYQDAGPENVATGILTFATDEGTRKARIAARWCDPLGWKTSLIERHNRGESPTTNDPALVISGLDNPEARTELASAGFDYMIDAGLGHGPVDFEGLQLRIVRAGVDISSFWSAKGTTKDLTRLLSESAYQEYAAKIDPCGARTIADASVAVPFVGTATGALVVAQSIRLATMLQTPEIFQMELGAPEMVTVGRFNPAPEASFGGISLRL